MALGAADLFEAAFIIDLYESDDVGFAAAGLPFRSLNKFGDVVECVDELNGGSIIPPRTLKVWPGRTGPSLPTVPAELDFMEI